MKELNTPSMTLTYKDRLLTITFKEKTVIDQKDVMELMDNSKKLVNGERFAVLVDGSSEHFMLQVAQNMLKANRSPNRLALAIVTKDHNTARRVGNFVNDANAGTPVQQFGDKMEALNWLNTFLQ